MDPSDLLSLSRVGETLVGIRLPEYRPLVSPAGKGGHMSKLQPMRCEQESQESQEISLKGTGIFAPSSSSMFLPGAQSHLGTCV